MGITPFLFVFKIPSSNWTSLLGRSSSLCFNQGGPSQQLELKKTLKEQPWEGRLAGFTSPCTCVHPFFKVRL
jgi:hypothetical protein